MLLPHWKTRLFMTVSAMRICFADQEVPVRLRLQSCLPWAALGTPGYLCESGAGLSNKIELRYDREIPETIYPGSLEKRRQQRWGGKTASRLVQKRLLASSWKGENKQHFSGLNKKRLKASFIGPIRATACGRQCWVLIWVLTKIFAGLRKPMT